MNGRALFTSIPKCGKNILTALFDALNVARIDHADEQGAAAHVMARWTQSARTDGRRLQPGHTDAVLDAYVSETEASMQALRVSLRSMPAGHYIHAHIGFDGGLLAEANEADVPIVFLYRDPRAMMASQAHFLIERGEPADLLPRLKSRSLASAYELLIEGDATTLPAHEFFAVYEGWLSAPGVLAVRFEDLVGSRGGGSVGTQLATVARIAQHVGWNGSTVALIDVAERIFNTGAGTFRRGLIDGWREDVPATIIERYPSLFVDLARRWGYDEAHVPFYSPQLDAAITREGSGGLRSALAAALADGDARLAHIHRLQANLRASELERRRLADESDERLSIVRRLEALLAATAAERDHLGQDADERLALVIKLQALLEAACSERDRFSQENDARLAMIRRGDARSGT
jgi:hypothetical protein